MGHLTQKIIVTLLFSAYFVLSVVADPFDTLNPRFSGISLPLRSVAYGNGVYVAVGDGGMILYSTDTITWIPRLSGTTNKLLGVGYGNNGFVAVGDSSPGTPSTILNSPDGMTWNMCVSPVTNRLSGICYGGTGRYVACGSQGVIVTSTNGVNWSSINTGDPFDLNGVVAGSVLITTGATHVEDIFIAVGNSGTILTSPNGLAWTVRFSGTFLNLNAVSMYRVYTGLMVAVGDSGTVETSSDGVTWTVQSTGTTSKLFAVANDVRGRFGAVGEGGVFIAGNGTGWTSQPSSTSNNLNGLLYVGGNFLAVGDSGSIQAGIAWLPRNSGTSVSLASVTYGASKFVAVGGLMASNVILSSSNGSEWITERASNEGVLNGVAFGSNTFVAVGNNGIVLSSTGNSSWIATNLNTVGGFECIAYGNGLFVAIGFSGSQTITYRSTDGVNWLGPVSLPVASTNLPGITFGNDLFVAVGQGGTLVTSPDGLNWTSRNSGVASYRNLVSVAYGNGLFAAIGVFSQTTTSPDGTNWSLIPFGDNDHAIAYGDDGFVVMANQLSTFGNIYATSADGITWVTRGMDGDIEGPQFRSTAFGTNCYVTVGDAGTIRQSTPVNAQAVPILDGRFTVGGFQLRASAQPGYSYRIIKAPDLGASGWSNLCTFVSTQNVTTFVDTQATNHSTGFYRIASP